MRGGKHRGFDPRVSGFTHSIWVANAVYMHGDRAFYAQLPAFICARAVVRR